MNNSSKCWTHWTHFLWPSYFIIKVKLFFAQVFNMNLGLISKDFCMSPTLVATCEFFKNEVASRLIAVFIQNWWDHVEYDVCIIHITARCVYWEKHFYRQQNESNDPNLVPLTCKVFCHCWIWTETGAGSFNTLTLGHVNYRNSKTQLTVVIYLEPWDMW